MKEGKKEREEDSRFEEKTGLNLMLLLLNVSSTTQLCSLVIKPVVYIFNCILRAMLTQYERVADLSHDLSCFVSTHISEFNKTNA